MRVRAVNYEKPFLVFELEAEFGSLKDFFHNSTPHSNFRVKLPAESRTEAVMSEEKQGATW